MSRARHPRCGLIVLAGLAPATSFAHSFGTPYILPVPFWMYAYGSAATLVVTFAMLGVFASASGSKARVEVHGVRGGGPPRIVAPWILRLLRTGATGALLLTILAGFVGTQDPAENIGMTLFWVIFLLGFTYLISLVGDLYALINPWQWAMEGLQRMGLDLSKPRVRFPPSMGYWLAFLFYVALVWIELFTVPKPFMLSILLLGYSAITFAGVAALGKAIWFEHADLFSVFFRLVGKIAPVEYTQLVPPNGWQVSMRPPFSGLLHDRPTHLSVVLVVLFMLSSTTYDSIHDTALWAGLFWKHTLVLLQPLWGTDLGKAQEMLMGGYLVYRQAGLLVFPFLYFALYVLILFWAKVLTKTAVPLRDLVLVFCYSLLPIAVAYHFTHYFTFLIVQLQSLPALLSDPFGFGWNLLGLGPDTAQPVLNMAAIWHTQVAALLLGHLVSIYLAHHIAIRTFPTQTKVVVSQLPLLILMVIYTWSGLWILSLPLGGD